MARAHGSYPWCREFKSPFRYCIEDSEDKFLTGFSFISTLRNFFDNTINLVVR